MTSSLDAQILGPVHCHGCHLLVTVHRDYRLRDWSRFGHLVGRLHVCTGKTLVNVADVWASNSKSKRVHGMIETKEDDGER